MATWVVAVGASAGGVEAISNLLELLPADFNAAVLVVLHLPENSFSRLPDIIARRAKLPTKFAQNNEELRPKQIYVSRPGHHLLVSHDRVLVTDGPRENGHRPAIDPLFRTVGRAAGPASIGVILSGLLDDGSAGMQALRRFGGTCIAQDPEDALFGDMPGNAILAAGITEVHPLQGIAQRLVEIVSTPAPEFAMQDSAPLTAALNLEEVAQLEANGQATQFTCPECGGALYDDPGHGHGAFRCRVGHTYGPETLLSAQCDSVEAAMWTALRALEENAALHERMHERALKRSNPLTAEKYHERSLELRGLAEVVRSALLSARAAEPQAT